MSDDDVTSLADERRRLFGELELERNQLLRNIDFCRIRDIEHPFIGEWSLKDIVGHIATWEAHIVTALGELAAGRRPELMDFQGGRLDVWNQDHVERNRSLDFGAVVAQLKDGRQRILDAASRIPDDELLTEGSVYLKLLRYLAAHDREHWHLIAAKLAGAPGVKRPVPVSLPEEIARQA